MYTLAKAALSGWAWPSRSNYRIGPVGQAEQHWGLLQHVDLASALAPAFRGALSPDTTQDDSERSRGCKRALALGGQLARGSTKSNQQFSTHPEPLSQLLLKNRWFEPRGAVNAGQLELHCCATLFGMWLLPAQKADTGDARVLGAPPSTSQKHHLASRSPPYHGGIAREETLDLHFPDPVVYCSTLRTPYLRTSRFTH